MVSSFSLGDIAYSTLDNVNDRHRMSFGANASGVIGGGCTLIITLSRLIIPYLCYC